jgi:3-mercaptopyruvate sulfurtransferase SseA
MQLQTICRNATWYMLISQVYATFEPQPQLHRRATSGDMLQALDDKQDGKDIMILDARGLEQYTGEVSCLMSCQAASCPVKQ